MADETNTPKIPEMVERVAVRLFWKSEHLDPSADSADSTETEWFGDAFPTGLNERDRWFWRHLARDAILSMRVPTGAMKRAWSGPKPWDQDSLEVWRVPTGAMKRAWSGPKPWDQDSLEVWQEMIDAAIADK